MQAEINTLSTLKYFQCISFATKLLRRFQFNMNISFHWQNKYGLTFNRMLLVAVYNSMHYCYENGNFYF